VPIVRVVSAAESAARDRAAIEAGVPSRALMRAAGMAAAGEIARRLRARLTGGVAVYAGPGNNGGDAWVVAGALAVAGVPVRVAAVGEPRSGDAAAEREAARPALAAGPPLGSERIVVDGLLGTGSSGAPRGAIADAVRAIAEHRRLGATVVALDVPTGVDATSGVADGAVRADWTLTFGALKRGLAIARDVAGHIVVLDIGLGAAADGAGAGQELPALVDAHYVRARLPEIRADAHKGVRRRIAIVAGGDGMVGAAILAARSALASGVGLVRLFVAPGNVPLVQTAAYEALAAPWPADDAGVRHGIAEWADALLLGPGLGHTPAARALVERVLGGTRIPTVVDADALNAFAGQPDALATCLAGRPAIVTPHPAECARLIGAPVADVLGERFDVGRPLAARLGATVLLKGVPTILSAPDGQRLVSAAGSPVLATGGSGDVLAGVVTTLLAQTGDPLESAACGAWVHGMAGELAGRRRVRGVLLDQVIDALAAAWRPTARPARYPVLAELRAVGEERR